MVRDGPLSCDPHRLVVVVPARLEARSRLQEKAICGSRLVRLCFPPSVGRSVLAGGGSFTVTVALYCITSHSFPFPEDECPLVLSDKSGWDHAT